VIKIVRSEKRGLKTLPSEERERPAIGYAPIVAIFAGLFLAARAIAFPSSVPYAVVLLVVRVALAIAPMLWAFLFLNKVSLAASSRLYAWVTGEGRSGILLGWSVAVSAADMLAGAGPIVFVASAAYAAAIGWDRMGRFVALASVGFAVLALAALIPPLVGTAPLRVEDILTVAAAAAASIAVARTVKSFVAPGRERLRSLERENKQLWDLSFRDTLTGLYNRRFAQETGRTLISRARRYHEQLHVFMLDIDHFKKVNDQVSHAVGDEVLKGVALAIQTCLRTSDSVARYGGEEFLAFVVQAEPEVAQFIANRIREAVASKSYAEVGWQVTISIGVASVKDGDDLETLIDRADQYLYSSKRGGRNRVSGF